MALIGQFSQTVTIDNVTFRVRDLNLSNDSDSRVAKIRLAIDPDSNRQKDTDLIRAGAQMVVSQSFDGKQKITSGLVLAVNHSRAGNRDVIQVEGVSEEYQMQRVRFAYLWSKTPADELIADAFARFAPGFGLSIINDPTVIESMEIIYDSMYDLLQQICRITGKAWRIDNGTLVYFDPLARTSRPIQQPLDIEGSTAQISDSLEGVYNIARMQAYEFAETWAEQYVRPGQCLNTLYIDQKWADWTLANSPIVQGVEFIDGRPEITASWSPDGEVKLSRGVTTPYEEQPLLVRVRLKFKRLVWVEKANQESINEFGVLPAPAISGNDSVGIPSAEQILNNYLAEKSRPVIKATMGLTVFDHDVDSICRLTYPTRGIDQDLFVKSYSIATNGAITTATVELVSPSSADLKLVQRTPDPVVDIEKRVTRLEKRRASLSSQQGDFAYAIGPIRFAPIFFDNWDWSDVAGLKFVPGVADDWGWSEQIGTVVIPGAATSDNWDWQESSAVKLFTSPADNWDWQARAEAAFSSSLLDLWDWSESVIAASVPVDSVSDSWGWSENTITDVSIQDVVFDQWDWTEATTHSVVPVNAITDNWAWSESAALRFTISGGKNSDSWGWRESTNVIFEQVSNLSADNSITVGTVGFTVEQSVTVGVSKLYAGNDVTVAQADLTADGSVTVDGVSVDSGVTVKTANIGVDGSIYLSGYNVDDSVMLDGVQFDESVNLGGYNADSSVTVGSLNVDDSMTISKIYITEDI